MRALPWVLLVAVISFLAGAMFYADEIERELKAGMVTYAGDAYRVTPVPLTPPPDPHTNQEERE